jgi:hypothetical protein
MKQNKTIHISEQEYCLYLSIFGQNVTIQGFRKHHIPHILLHNAIGNEVSNRIINHKIHELLGKYTEVSNVKFKNTMTGLSFNVTIEFEGTEKPQSAKSDDTSNGAYDTSNGEYSSTQSSDGQKDRHVHGVNCNPECSVA